MFEIYDEITTLLKKGGRAVLATVISTESHTPRNVGAKILICSRGRTIGSIGGGELEKRVIAKAEEILDSKEPAIMHFDLRENKNQETGMICGGTMNVFLEPIISMPELIIFGGGHIAVPLTRFASETGFRVTVIEERQEYASDERFPGAVRVICQDFLDSIGELDISKSSYIVIATAGHIRDEDVLERIIDTDAGYIGLMASPKKRDTIFEHLTDKGISKTKLDRVYSPIGLQINSETPEEIAISIMGQIIKNFRNRKMQ